MPSIDIYSRNNEDGSMGVGAGLLMYDVVVKKFTFAISSPDEFLYSMLPTVGEFFSATVCKTVRPMLSDRCPSVCPVCLSDCLSCPALSLSVTLVYCGQTVGRIKMKLGMQVGLGPGHIVLDGDPAPLP